MPRPPASVEMLPDALVCPCGHRGGEHDPVAARYCAVTTTAALARECICPVGPAARARSYDRR